MRIPAEQRPCAIGRAVCGTVGLAGLLVRLSAGVVAVACLGYLFTGRIKKSGKKGKKIPLSPPCRSNGMFPKSVNARRFRGRR